MIYMDNNEKKYISDKTLTTLISNLLLQILYQLLLDIFKYIVAI